MAKFGISHVHLNAAIVEIQYYSSLRVRPGLFIRVILLVSVVLNVIFGVGRLGWPTLKKSYIVQSVTCRNPRNHRISQSMSSGC
jgi:hypothetical protein